MPGLSLRTGIQAGANYSPMTPASANPSTASASIGQKAYGINGSGTGIGPRTAAYGGVGVGVACVGLLVYLWYSLPR